MTAPPSDGQRPRTGAAAQTSEPAQTAEPAQTVHSEPRCPWCGSAEVERVAPIGAQLMSEQYFCLSCHSPFERIRK